MKFRQLRVIGCPAIAAILVLLTIGVGCTDETNDPRKTNVRKDPSKMEQNGDNFAAIDKTKSSHGSEVETESISWVKFVPGTSALLKWNVPTRELREKRFFTLSQWQSIDAVDVHIEFQMQGIESTTAEVTQLEEGLFSLEINMPFSLERNATRALMYFKIEFAEGLSHLEAHCFYVRDPLADGFGIANPSPPNLKTDFDTALCESVSVGELVLVD